MREDGFMEQELQIQELREQLSNVQRRVDNQERVLREVVTLLAKLRAANQPVNSSA